MDLRDGTGSENALEMGPSTKAPGAMDYRMATGQRPTRMEVSAASIPSGLGRVVAWGYEPLNGDPGFGLESGSLQPASLERGMLVPHRR